MAKRQCRESWTVPKTQLAFSESPTGDRGFVKPAAVKSLCKPHCTLIDVDCAADCKYRHPVLQDQRLLIELLRRLQQRGNRLRRHPEEQLPPFVDVQLTEFTALARKKCDGHDIHEQVLSTASQEYSGPPGNSSRAVVPCGARESITFQNTTKNRHCITSCCLVELLVSRQKW